MCLWKLTARFLTLKRLQLTFGVQWDLMTFPLMFRYYSHNKLFICIYNSYNQLYILQHCDLEIGSFLHSVSYLQFNATSVVPISEPNSVIDYTVEMDLKPQYQEKIRFGTWSFAGFRLKMTRKSSKYLVRYILPSALVLGSGLGMPSLVAIQKTSDRDSWFQVSFVIPYHIIPGRLALLVTLQLTLVNILMNFTDELPTTNQPTALTVYIIASILFIFKAIVAYAFLLGVDYRAHMRKTKSITKGGVTTTDTKTVIWICKMNNLMFFLYPITVLIYHIAFLFVYYLD